LIQTPGVGTFVGFLEDGRGLGASLGHFAEDLLVGTFVGSLEDGRGLGTSLGHFADDLLDFAEDDVVLLDFPELLVFSDFLCSGSVGKEGTMRGREEQKWGLSTANGSTRYHSVDKYRPTFEVNLNNFFACFERAGFAPIALEDPWSALRGSELATATMQARIIARDTRFMAVVVSLKILA